MDLPLRASDEHIPIVRVPRAQKTISPHPLLFQLLLGQYERFVNQRA